MSSPVKADESIGMFFNSRTGTLAFTRAYQNQYKVIGKPFCDWDPDVLDSRIQVLDPEEKCHFFMRLLGACHVDVNWGGYPFLYPIEEFCKKNLFSEEEWPRGVRYRSRFLSPPFLLSLIFLFYDSPPRFSILRC